MDTKTLQEQFQKIAFGGFGREFTHALTTGAAGALATAGVAGAGIAASKIYEAVTKNRDFKSMLQSPFNADLQQHYESRPKEFNAAFSSLRTMNPEFSKDPMVAGTYMRRMMTYDPGSAGGVLVEALSHRDRFDAPLHESMLTGAREGAKAGLGGAIRDRQQQETNAFNAGRDDLKHRRDMEAEQRQVFRQVLQNHFRGPQGQQAVRQGGNPSP